MTAAICDDSIIDRELLARLLADHFCNIEISEYEDGNLMIAAHAKFKYDLIFLDMLMPAIDGLKVAEKIRQFDDQTPIIFITTTDEYAVQSYRVQAFDYLLKPINVSDLTACIRRFMSRRDNTRLMTIDYNGVTAQILINNILYLESVLRKVNIHLVNGQVIEVSGKLRDFRDQIQDTQFCQCHKSYLINLAYVEGLDSSEFKLGNHEKIKISRQFLNDAKTAYFNYTFGQSGSGEQHRLRARG